MPATLKKSAVTTGLEKVSFHSNPKKGYAKECLNYCTISLNSQASKVMLKILQVRLHKLDLEKAEDPDIKLPAFTES